MTVNSRVADYPIDPQFTERWSPRAFTAEAIGQETLLSFFEAARWAPSAYNSQPWRFLYARRDTPNWERFLGLLNEFNRGWAQHASALVIVISKTTFTAPGATEEGPALCHSFDTGAAWGYLALQASLSGWHTHAMAGFDKDLTRQELNVPEGYALHAAVAIGKLGDKSTLAEYLQGRETPGPRRPLSELAAEGGFSL
ncbi:MULTISPECIES: nitroreductase family protein [unclassified Pseudomonas]|uniref:nitroreductase family protein n=1 Tax=unclassified Pseudomonas TaxID=196821 RepID=UPI002AC92CE2|nr:MULTISPECIES: nitroreductase family protein [unclassified Pseudomonas]MEB0043056.1 nitroreductase family protein [Pseudomonas sp. MH10]MEB0080238.1 nitroreductase family protein [Pseudomonas sp. MH10out]MEB0094313.1 nitroreductase family protein [Pseudomonas sp. CCI4.2]MEB0104488.1 nitroreductase family protein [Pseudomonas sp. CCI3.2]MEB0121447.1 nitroreductase family protein [Pseudomonas sp. CCI1.2]